MKEIGTVKEIRPELMRSEIRVNGQDKGFSERLSDAVSKVNEANLSADKAAEQVVKGEMDIHEGMMRMQEADLSLRLLLQVRSKVLEAYREILHMQM